MRRSLRIALDEDLGLPAHSDSDDIGVGHPLSEIHPEWCQNALDYLDSLRNWLSAWHDQPGKAEKHPPLRFDDWLKDRGEREYDIRHGLMSRTDRVLHRFTGPHEERP